MARPPSTAEEVARTRATLLDAAQALYEDGGSEAMSFRAIASSAGCSHSKPYSYFDSKADLVDALRIRSYEMLHERLSMAAALHEEPIDSLRELAEAYVRFGVQRPRMYGLLYSDEGQMSETLPALFDAKIAALGICRDVIAEAAEAGSLDLATDPFTSAHVFWAGAHGLVELHLGGFLVVGRSIDELLPNLFETLIDGLSS